MNNEESKTIGICLVIDIISMKILIYVYESFDLALAQAEEFFKKSTINQDYNKTEAIMPNGHRFITFTYPREYVLIQVSETEIGNEILLVK